MLVILFTQGDATRLRTLRSALGSCVEAPSGQDIGKIAGYAVGVANDRQVTSCEASVGSAGPSVEGGFVDSVALAYARPAGEAAERAQPREQAVQR